jgi:hypothetical protein
MAVNVGTLTIDLKANTATFSQSMDKMSQLSAKTANDISRSLQKIAVASAAAIGALTAGLTALVHSSLESIDSLDKLSQATGTTAESLSLLQYAAALSNVESEQLSVSLTKLAKAEFQAATGNVELSRVFKKLGVDVMDGNKHLKDTGVVYEELAVKFAKMQDGPLKTALAIQLFGKAGASQIPLLNQLGAEFEAIQQEAQQFGLIVGTSTAHLAGEAHDQLDRLQQVLKGLGYSILSAVLPAMSQLLDNLIDIAKQANIPDLAKSFSSDVSDAITTFGKALAFATKHAQALKIALEALAAVQVSRILLPLISDLATGGWSKVGAGVGKFVTNLLGLSRVIPILKDFAGWIGYTTRFIGLMAEEEGILSAATWALRGAFVALGGWITVIIGATVGLGVALYSLRDHIITLEGEVFKLKDVYSALGAAMAAVARGNIGNFAGAFSAALIQAKNEREAAEKAAAAAEAAKKKKDTTTKQTGAATDITGLGKPEADPYGEAIKKLNLAIDAQQKYLNVLHGTPEAIAAVTAAEKADATILEINTKLKEKDKKLSADQEATIREKVAREESLKALEDYGKSLVDQQRNTDLSIAQTAVLTAAYAKGDEAVRRVTVSNAILGLTMGKTAEQIQAMTGELATLATKMLQAADAKAMSDFNKTLVDQQRQLQLATTQADALANAYGEDDRAVREANINNAILALQFGKTDEEIKAMTADLEKLRAAMEANADAAERSTAARDLKALQDEIENEKQLTGAIFGTIEAQRQAAIAVRLRSIDDQIAATTDAATIAKLQEKRAATEQLMRSQYAAADAQQALQLRSPLEVYEHEKDALDTATKALMEAQGGFITYQQSLVIAAKAQDDFNKATDETVNLLLRTGQAGAGVRAFFLDMEKQATSSARIIYDALHTTFDKLSDNLTELVTGGKADFAAMIRDIGKQMTKQSMQALMQKGLGWLGEKLGIDLGTQKPDGSTAARALWVKIAGSSGPLPTMSQSPSQQQQSSGGIFGGGWTGGMVFSVIGEASTFLAGLGGLLGGSGAIPHAEGGLVSPNRAYLVGERGPEILTGASGKVLSTDTSHRILTGGANPSVHYYTIDARGTDPVLTEQRTRAAIIAAHNSAIVTSTQVQQERAQRRPPVRR